MRPDDDRLLQSLHDGVFETPIWGDFLHRLLARTGAKLVNLLFRSVDRDALVERHAGDSLPQGLRPLLIEGQPSERMRPDRAYALDELLDQAGPALADFDQAVLRPAGLTSLRAIRVVDPTGADLWLACAGGKGIGAATSALLTALAPHLRIALRTHVTLERARFRSVVTEQVASRLRMGWFTLDARCRIIEATDNIEQMFQWGTLLRRGRYDRLVPASPQIDRAVTALVKGFAETQEARPQAFVLGQDPWVDMLVSPFSTGPVSGGITAAGIVPAGIVPAAIVYVRGDRRSQADRCEQLVDLFGLLPSEARLAWMLAQATSIAEAADALGLTVETARNYSKKIYAKTGARGHAELVRIILTSVLAIS